MCQVSCLGGEEAYPVARVISSHFTCNHEYTGLPREFKSSVTGCSGSCASSREKLLTRSLDKPRALDKLDALDKKVAFNSLKRPFDPDAPLFI